MTHSVQMFVGPPGVALAQGALDRARFSFATRRVRRSAIKTLLARDVRPAAGDLVLAAITRLGQHRYLQGPDGRRANLFVGDEIVLTYGARYAPDQYEARVPSALGPCHLIAGGGLAGEAISWASGIRSPTQIEPLGLLGDAAGRRLNLRDFALPVRETVSATVPVIAVVGTAMNAGKTTAAASVIHGATVAGLRVGAAKTTGTGAGNDYWMYADAGAAAVLDFTDCGYASTYLIGTAAVERVFSQLVAQLDGEGVDLIVVEIADGLFQEETAALLGSHAFVKYADGVIFCAGDALGASGGVDWLEQRGLPVLGVSGCLTQSPLAMREAATVTRLPVWTRDELADAEVVRKLVASCRRPTARRGAFA
jgi:dethiobiotin synthetase